VSDIFLPNAINQVAVYWAPAAQTTDKYGQPLWAEPVQINVRWTDVSIQFLDSEGNTLMSTAEVNLDQDVEVGGVLFLGLLTALTDRDNPKENLNAWEIKRYEKLPTFKATKFWRAAFL